MDPKVVPLADHIEASAFAVLLVLLLKQEGKSVEDYFSGIGQKEGTWCIILKKDPPKALLEAIMGGIRADQLRDPEKWTRARAAISTNNLGIVIEGAASQLTEGNNEVR